jgi:hypothetical protein
VLRESGCPAAVLKNATSDLKPGALVELGPDGVRTS